MFMFIYNAHFQEFSNDAAMCSPLQQFHYNIFQSKFAAENNSVNRRERNVLKVCFAERETYFLSSFTAAGYRKSAVNVHSFHSPLN